MTEPPRISALSGANDADGLTSFEKTRDEDTPGREQSLADWFAVGAQISEEVGRSGVSVLASPV